MIIFLFLTDWDKENITEPPPTKHISLEDLNKISSGEKHLAEFIPKVMSHSIGKQHAFKKLTQTVPYHPNNFSF